MVVSRTQHGWDFQEVVTYTEIVHYELALNMSMNVANAHAKTAAQSLVCVTSIRIPPHSLHMSLADVNVKSWVT